MSRRHYQVITLGDSLAARLAGALLAKHGIRVLACTEADAPEGGGWFFSSSLLEKILEDLDGRSCYVSPFPFQVLTPDSRLDFQGDSTLEEEFRRELPAASQQSTAFLKRLAESGERLESVLWEGALLPLFGPVSRLAFAWRSLRGGVDRRLRRLLSELLAPFHDDTAGRALKTLFAGLALAPAERLSMAEAALLWSACTRPRSVSASGLDALLRHRFTQFHGEEIALSKIAGVRPAKGGDTVILLRDGAEYHADHLLLGSRDAFSLLPDEMRRNLPSPPVAAIFTAALPESHVSPMLAPRIILAGDPELRLNLAPRESRMQVTVETYGGDTGAPTAAVVQKRIATLFPFAEVIPVLRQEAPPLPPSPRKKSFFPGATGSQRIGNNLLLCHGGTLFPTLGATGEILTAFTAVRYLTRRLKLRTGR